MTVLVPCSIRFAPELLRSVRNSVRSVTYVRPSSRSEGCTLQTRNWSNLIVPLSSSLPPHQRFAQFSNTGTAGYRCSSHEASPSSSLKGAPVDEKRYNSGASDAPSSGPGCGTTVTKDGEVSAEAGVDDDEMEQEEMFVEPHESFAIRGKEWGGPRRGGRFPEPTRYNDWERKGRCSDF